SLGNARGVESDLTLLADQDIASADLGLQPLDVLAQPLVGVEKLPTDGDPARRNLGTGTDQGLTDKNFACLPGRDRSVVDTPSRGEREPIERHGFIRRHEPAIRHPVRLAEGALREVRTRALDPRWVDRGHHPRVEARGFDETPGDDPLGWPGGERRAGGDHEAHTPRAVVFALLIERPDGTEEARQDRLVQVRVTRGRVIRPQIELADAAGELMVKILPLAHAEEGKEMLSAPLAQLTARKRRGLLAEGAPEIEHRDEIRAPIRKESVLLVCLPLHVGRAL